MYKTHLSAAILVVAALSFASHAQTGTYTCSNFQFITSNNGNPNAIPAANALNDLDFVVGSFLNYQQESGFSYPPGGPLSQYNVPGSALTSFDGINDLGLIVGWWAQSTEPTSGGDGFVLFAGGIPVNIVHPNAQRTWANGINNLGTIVGYYSPESGGYTGYVLSGGQFKDISVSGASETQPAAINDEGVIVGWWSGFSPFGFIYDNGTFTLEYGPPGTGELFFSGINDQNEIAGSYLNTNVVGLPPLVGFVYSGGNYNVVQVPNATGTYTVVNGINNRGDITGYVQLTNGTEPGFLGTGCHL